MKRTGIRGEREGLKLEAEDVWKIIPLEACDHWKKRRIAQVTLKRIEDEAQDTVWVQVEVSNEGEHVADGGLHLPWAPRGGMRRSVSPIQERACLET